MTEPNMNDQAEARTSEEAVLISIDAASRINVAFHQNHVPVIGGIEVQNATQADLTDLSVVVTSGREAFHLRQDQVWRFAAAFSGASRREPRPALGFEGGSPG
jgi:hypothetical protein